MRPRASALQAKVLALVFMTVAALASSAAHAQSRDEARRIAADIHQRDGYADGLHIRQADGTVSTFPPGAEGKSDATDARRFDRGTGTDGVEDRRASDDRRGSPPETMPSLHWPQFNGAWLARILQVVAVLALLAMVIAVAMAVIRRGAAPPSAKAPAAPRPGPAHMPEADALPWETGDPDALFGEGKLAEAIVALLVQSLRFAGWAPERERGRTAREVLRSLATSDARRPPLSRILRGAERVRFAGELPTPDLYQELRCDRDELLASGAESTPDGQPSEPQ